MAIAETISILQLCIDALSMLKDTLSMLKKEKPDVASSIRKALKELYFSKATIQRLASIRSISNPDERYNVVGKALQKQRDNESDVQQSFKVLRSISNSDNTSIEAGHLMDMIIWGKINIRKELGDALLYAASSGDAEAIDNIIAKISKLNEQISELDQKLGNAIL